MFTLFDFVKVFWNIKFTYHSLYSVPNFDWLIYLQITACK